MVEKLRNLRRFDLLILALGLVVGLLAIPTINKTFQANDRSLQKLPPPLADVDFPLQTIAYPSDWPSELRYPEPFKLVDVSSGVPLQGDSKCWAAKLLFAGSPESASLGLAAFFTQNGWEIAERTQLDSGGFLLLIQRSKIQQSGAVVIDSDPSSPGGTRVLLTIFL